MSPTAFRAQRSRLAAAGGLVAAAGATGAILLSGGSAQAHTVRPVTAPAKAAASTTISAHSTSLGTILVDSKGDTLYAFSKDSKNKDACAAIKGCLKIWPIAAANGKLKAGSGVNAKMLGSIKVGSQHQVTYAGHPLYGYVGNDEPADTDYVGISQSGGTWPAVSPSGKLIK